MCDHMIEKDCVQSFHYGIPAQIHSHLSHDKWPDGFIRWYVYAIEDIPCHKQIVGSTSDPTSRWRNHKSACNSRNSNSTGLSKHFKTGCPNDQGRDKRTLDVTLLDYYDTTKEKLVLAKHEPGAKCRCQECGNLKLIKDKWILKLGSFYNHGLNSRDEVKTNSRYKW